MRTGSVSPTLLTVALVAAAVAAGGLIGASLLGGSETRDVQAGAPLRTSSLAGVPQDGLALGSADAPVTLVEYADLQCPYCATWAEDVLPRLADEYVRAGKLRIVFRGLAFIGPESDLALRASLAAAEQDRLWPYVDLLYANQGPENGGWIDDDLLERVADSAGVDWERASVSRDGEAVAKQIESAARAASAAGVRGTPSFELGTTRGGFELVDDGSYENLAARLDALLE